MKWCLEWIDCFKRKNKKQKKGRTYFLYSLLQQWTSLLHSEYVSFVSLHLAYWGYQSGTERKKSVCENLYGKYLILHSISTYVFTLPQSPKNPALPLPFLGPAQTGNLIQQM